MNISTEMRLRTRVSDDAIKEQVLGRVLGPADYDVLLTGPTRVRRPDGQPLCIYLPGAIAGHAGDEDTYEVLHSLRTLITKNRGAASGTKRVGAVDGRTKRNYARETASAVIGAVDPLGQSRYCRLTAWTGRHLPEWTRLQPLLQTIAGHLQEHVPDRFAAQMAEAARTDPAWVVPGTPFSTITVNNTYPTGVHKDKGDLDTGFSTIGVLRRGQFTGGQLVFPAWRVAVDLHDGDLILMDAHEWHGNVVITCACGAEACGVCDTCGAERISVVSYFRTKVADCGSPDEELRRADRRARALA